MKMLVILSPQTCR